MALHRLLGTLLLFILVLFTAAHTWAEPLKLPLTLDLPLLRALIVQQAFTQPGEKAAILNQGQGCNQIVLHNPQISVDRNTLRLHTKVQIKWGTPVMDSCLTPLLWEGSVVLWQRPKINAQWQLSFETVNSAILDKTNKPIKAVDLLWDLVKEHVHGYLNKITINLAPPVNDMKNCLQVMFDRDHQQAAQRFFASMRPEPPTLFPEGLQVIILADFDSASSAGGSYEPVPEPTAQEYARVIDFYRDMNQRTYKISYEYLAEESVKNWVQEGKLFLFRIHSKDFSPGSTGRPNLHTMYWKGLFDEDNLRDVVLKLNGNAELFYREASKTV